ncbi:MAG: PadR family transcriptional regulator [Planctomycetaceae bacterium]
MSLENILLGMLREPASGYELRREFEEGAQHFWSARLSQIYPTLQRLEEKGLLKSSEKPSEKGPPRRVYKRTKRGTQTLHKWLLGEPVVGTQRFAYIAQLVFMSELNDLAATRSFMVDLRERLAGLLQILQTIAEPDLKKLKRQPHTMGAAEFHDVIAIRMGLKSLASKVEWCDESLAMIDARTKHEREN